MTRRLLPASLLLVLLAACQVGGETTSFVPGPSCTPVGAACGGNADCCSYGCASGICTANPIPGGVCRTSDDCGVALSATGYGYDSMLCVSGVCATGQVCRQDVDVCASDSACCSGNCVGATYLVDGACAPNHAPIVELGETREIPYHATATLLPDVSDPDGDTLVFGWALVSRPPFSAVTLSAPTARTLTFVPDVVGPYTFRLVVTDGTAPQRSRLTTEDTVTLVAVNTPPAVSAGPDAPHASRGVAQTLSGTVSDADNDSLTCTWAVTPPGGTAMIVASSPACTGTFTGTFTCADQLQEGAWTATLEVSDGVNTVSDSATYTCANDAPVAIAGPDRFWNLGEPVSATPALRLTGSSTDTNGDAPATHAWTVVDPLPTGTAYAHGELLPAVTGNPAAIDFVPDVVGTFTLRYAVTDRPISEGAAIVTVDVARHVKDLAHDVRDADHAHTAGKLVLVGANPSPAALEPLGMLWVIDLATGTETSFPIGGAPLTAVDVAEDGTFAAVSDGTWVHRVDLGATFSEAWKVSQPTIDLAVAGSHVYAFPSASGQIMRVTTAGAAWTGYYGANGVAHPSGSPLYVAESSYDIRRYTVASGTGTGQGALSGSGYLSTPYCSSRTIWLTQNGQHVLDSCGAVYDASSTGTALTTEQVPPGVLHVDSLTAGQVALVTGDATVLRLNSSFMTLAADTLPHWATPTGASATASGHFVFLAADGTRFVIVRTTHDGVPKTGLVTFAP